MNESTPSSSASGGCISSVFLFVLLLFVMGAVISRPERGEAPLPTQAVAAQLPTVTLPATTNTAVPTHTASPTPTITQTPANTPTSTPTSDPTSTPLPPTPTFTPPPLPTPQDAYSWTLKVPILMYHYISTPPEDADVYRVDLSVEPDAFRAQMAYLAENGYSTIDFYDLSRAITNRQELPPKPVILTFDDGYVDNYENAFPILQEYGLTGVFFIVTEFIDNGRSGYLTWEMVREMAAAGHRFEPHSRTHPDLRGQQRDYLIWQILGPQETIAHHIGYTPRYFSYPSGAYDEDVMQILLELDFWGAVTTRSGKEHGFVNRFEWPRLRVRNNTPLPEFIDLVEPGNAVGGRIP